MGRYSVSRKKFAPQFCINCDVEFSYRGRGAKYCSIGCSASHKWKETVAKIELDEEIHYESLKKYLLLKDPYCKICDVGTVWNDKPLTLQFDHIDGNSDNTRLSNSRLLCPNCHTQTETYGAKGMGNRYKKFTKRNKYLQEYKIKPE